MTPKFFLSIDDHARLLKHRTDRAGNGDVRVMPWCLFNDEHPSTWNLKSPQQQVMGMGKDPYENLIRPDVGHARHASF